MKIFVGVVVGLLFVVAVAVFTPSNASAHSLIFEPILFGDAVALVGCVDDKVADALIASGEFTAGAPVQVVCPEGHTIVSRIIRQGSGS